MAYVTDRLPLCEALQVLHARGNAVEELLAALKDGKVKAFGWINGDRKRIEKNWWDHARAYSDGVLWFDGKTTVPATPPRLQEIDVSQHDVQRLWPEKHNEAAAAVRDAASIEPSKPAASDKLLRSWALAKWPDRCFPGRDKLLKLARKEFSGVSETHIRALRREASEKNRKGGAPSHAKSKPKV